MVSPSSPGYLASPSCSSWLSAFLRVLPSLLSPSYPPILLPLQSAFSLAVFPLACYFGLPVPLLSLDSFARGNLPVLFPLTPYPPFPCPTCGSLPRAASASSSRLRTRTPFRRDVLLFIGPSSNSLCPVSAPRHYLPLRGYVPGPLFVSSNGCFLFSFLVNSWLRYVSHSLHYSSHSFRIGATISAADCESSSSPSHNSWSPVS